MNKERLLEGRPRGTKDWCIRDILAAFKYALNDIRDEIISLRNKFFFELS